MKEWLDSSPVSSVLIMVIIIAAVIFAIRTFKSITRPIFLTILIVAGVLLAFNVVDLAFLGATGKKFFSFLWDKMTGAAVDAASDAAHNAISNLGMILRF